MDTMAFTTLMVIMVLEVVLLLMLEVVPLMLPLLLGVSAKDLLKNPNKLSQPTPTVAPATSVKPSGDSPGPRGPLNPTPSTDTAVSTTPTLMDSEPTDPELPPTPAPPLLTPKGLPKVSAARGPPMLKLTMVTTDTNFLGLPFVPPDSLPPPGELVLMVFTGVEKPSETIV